MGFNPHSPCCPRTEVNTPSDCSTHTRKHQRPGCGVFGYRNVVLHIATITVSVYNRPLHPKISYGARQLHVMYVEPVLDLKNMLTVKLNQLSRKIIKDENSPLPPPSPLFFCSLVN